MLNRKIYNKLAEWKNSPDKKPIIIKGCRQCGKTFAVIEFAKANYKHVLYINFLEDKQAGLIFADSLKRLTCNIDLPSDYLLIWNNNLANYYITFIFTATIVR